jgi:hypothetical protein
MKQTFLTPGSVNNLHTALKNGVKCKILTAHAKQTVTLLREWVGFSDFTVTPIPDSEWVIFSPIYSDTAPDNLLTLATLCDIVLGEDALDRTNDTLIRQTAILKRENERLLAGIHAVLEECAHLADGDQCTLINLKRLVGAK